MTIPVGESSRQGRRSPPRLQRSTQEAYAKDANSGPRERITEGIARTLRGELAERRISGRHLAEMTGLSQSTMSRRLTGETPFDLDELEVVCGVLGLDPVELLRAQQRPRPDVTGRGR